MTNWQGFTGVNRAYVLELYERYLKDPSVDAESRAALCDVDAPGRGGRHGDARRHRRSPRRCARRWAPSTWPSPSGRYGHLAASSTRSAPPRSAIRRSNQPPTA